MTKKKKEMLWVFFLLQKLTVILSGPFTKMYLTCNFFYKVYQACKLMMPDPHFKISKDKGKIVSMSNRKSEVGG